MVKHHTYIDPEALAYGEGPLRSSPRGGRVRLPNGKLGFVRLGIPDTVWTIPSVAHVDGKRYTGFVSVKGDPEEYTFTVARRYNHWSNPCTCKVGSHRTSCDWAGCPLPKED